MKKNRLKAAALLGTAALLSGCGEKEPVSILVKVPSLSMTAVVDSEIRTASEFLTKAADAFEAVHPNARIQVMSFEQVKEAENITGCFDTPQAADVLYEGYFNMANYIHSGRVVPLDDIIWDGLREDISDSFWQMSQVDEKTYMMPFLSLQNTYVYNKELFRMAGLDRFLTEEPVIQSWTMAEWDEILAALKEALPKGTFVMPMYAKNNQGDTHVMTLIRCQGSSFFDENGRFCLNTENGIAGLQWIKDNYDKGYYPSYCENLEISDNTELFYNGQMAFMVGNSANTSVISFDYGVVNFPGNEGSGYATSFVTGFSVFDNGDEEKLRLAKEFVKYIYETEPWISCSAGGIPASKAVASQYGKQIPMLEEYYKNNSNVVDFTANNPNWAGVREVFYPHIHKLLTGEETAEEAAKGLDRDCNDAIEKGYARSRLHE